MKTCNKCGKKDLDWNRSWFEYSNRWQLINHKNKDGEWCINNSLKPKEKKLTKKDYTVCPLCSESEFGYYLNIEYEEHKRKYHPNGEIRNNSYYQV
tara:strand:- start:602 stop:889 length:288 start_codon:yes stop_codon:yes gene_type:complete